MINRNISNTERINTNEVKSLSTLTNDSKSANEIELEMMMQKPSVTEENNKDNESVNKKQLETKMHKSTDTQKDTEDNEREPDRISNSDATQILTIENKEVRRNLEETWKEVLLSLEERKSPTFNDSEDNSSTPAGKCF